MIDFALGIGESPVWDHRVDRLWFVDIARPAIYRCDALGKEMTSFPTPQTVCSLGLAPDGKLVVGLRDGVYLFDPASGEFAPLVTIETDRPENRLNDGRVGPDGAFWVGSMFETFPYEPTASFYRVSAQGDVRTIRSDIHVCNGLAWSPDGTRMYHVDSMIPTILAYDFDARTGDVAMTPPLVGNFDPAIGFGDGAAVDAEGCYWLAGVTAGRLNRFSPAGDLIDSVELPVRWPTMPCFGGPDLRTLFVTSMSMNDDGDGSLIAFDVDVPGLPADIFGQPRVAFTAA